MNILSPSQFPNPQTANEYGVVSVGDKLSVATLVDAYAHGIFPWPHKGYPLLWFSPEERGVVFFKKLHCPQSFKKWLRKTTYRITFDAAFEKVILGCATVLRPGQQDTWIDSKMAKAYFELHQQGFAHSVECWDGGELVGGLYGVYVEGVFSAESMFFLRSGASKMCLYHLILRLQGLGLEWLDTQMVTPVVEQFGGEYISRSDFLNLLLQSQKSDRLW